MAIYVDADSVWRDRAAYPNPCDYQITPEQVLTWTKATRQVRALPRTARGLPLDFASTIDLISATLPYPRVELYANRFIEVDNISGGTTLTTLDPHGLVVGDVVITSSPGYTGNGIERNVYYHVVTIVSPTEFQVSLTPGGPVQPLTDGTGLGMVLAVLGDPADPTSDYVTVTTNTNAALQLLRFPRIYLDIHSLRYNDPRCLRTIGGILADAKFVLRIDGVQTDDQLQPLWIHYKPQGAQVMRFKRDDPLIIRFMTRDGTIIPFFVEPDLTIPINPDKQTMITFSNEQYFKDGESDGDS